MLYQNSTLPGQNFFRFINIFKFLIIIFILFQLWQQITYQRIQMTENRKQIIITLVLDIMFKYVLVSNVFFSSSPHELNIGKCDLRMNHG